MKAKETDISMGVYQTQILDVQDQSNIWTHVLIQGNVSKLSAGTVSKVK